MPDEIVSIGLLTARDLEILGQGFRRHFPVRDDELPARPEPPTDGRR